MRVAQILRTKDTRIVTIRPRESVAAAAKLMVTENIGAETARLKAAGVIFRGEPAATGPLISVLFEDTCGNLISLTQPPL